MELTSEMQESITDVLKHQGTQKSLLMSEHLSEHLSHTKLMGFNSRGEMTENQSEQSQEHMWRDVRADQRVHSAGEVIPGLLPQR